MTREAEKTLLSSLRHQLSSPSPKLCLPAIDGVNNVAGLVSKEHRPPGGKMWIANARDELTLLGQDDLQVLPAAVQYRPSRCRHYEAG